MPAERGTADLPTVEGVIDRAAADAPLGPLHLAVHGTDDATEVAAQVERVVHDHLDTAIRGGLFHVASVGSVTGIELVDGRRVVVKVVPPRFGSDYLVAVGEVQNALAGQGWPCARRLAGPVSVGVGLAVVDTFLPDPGQPATFGVAEMRTSALGLAAFIEAAPLVDGLDHHSLTAEVEGLYPPPHSPLFDFAATATGAEWIDELASIARPLLREGRLVVGHTDWAARNVRLTADGVRAIYDMDSVALAPLAGIVAQAAVCWRATGESDDTAAPDVAEIDAWLAELPLDITPVERRAIDANALYHLAYSSRCEHAIDPHERRLHRARPTLRSAGPTLAQRCLGAPSGSREPGAS
jgi:hypothetical protein